MKLPALNEPSRYAGLYVFDFGDQVAVGYTADEVAVLLESERYQNGKVYKIHRARPDGTMELAGVANARFTTEDGLFFYRDRLAEARADFAELEVLAEREPPPARAKVHLVELRGDTPAYITALIFPAEYSHEMGQWLSRVGYRGGDRVEGGVSAVTTYYAGQRVILDRHQLSGASDAVSRPTEEVLATTRVAVQR
jgi:hypothetical protein